MKTILAPISIVAALFLTPAVEAQQEEASVFIQVTEGVDGLSEGLEEWSAQWDDVADIIDEQYGDFAEERTFEEGDEIDEDEIPETEGTFPVDGETLNALYMAAVEVDRHFEAVGGELAFLGEFMETSSFPEEREEANEKILENVESLRAQLEEASDHWQEILDHLDRTVEGDAPALDQGGNPIASMGQRQRSAIRGLHTQRDDAPSISISRSEMETGGWNLTQLSAGVTKSKKTSKKKHTQASATTSTGRAGSRAGTQRGLVAESYEAHYSVIAWGGLFIGHEIALLNESVAEFADAVALAVENVQQVED